MKKEEAFSQPPLHYVTEILNQENRTKKTLSQIAESDVVYGGGDTS